MKINTQWNLGQFSISLASEVDEAMRERLAALGLRFLGQRNSEVDKILGGFKMNAKGKQERIKGFKRNEVSFSQALADKLAASFAELGLPDSEDKLEAEVLVVQYTPTTKEPAFAYERKIWTGKNAKGSESLQKLAKLVEYDGEHKDADGNAPEDFLKAIKVWADGVA